MTADGQVKASVTVTNTGKRDGKEVVQLYVRDIYATSSRPVKELKGFEKSVSKPARARPYRLRLAASNWSTTTMRCN